MAEFRQHNYAPAVGGGGGGAAAVVICDYIAQLSQLGWGLAELGKIADFKKNLKTIFLQSNKLYV